MDGAIAARLLEINRRFYLEHGADFADTRGRVQPGVRRLLETMRPEEDILDLGCGNGAFARALSRNGHRGRYLGVDFSPVLLERARAGPYRFGATFVQADLASPELRSGLADSISVEMRAAPREAPEAGWDVVTMFAVLHHLPGHRLRLDLLNQVRQWLRSTGRLILSNWQFSNNIRLHARILPWTDVGLLESDVDPGDHLVDWRRGGAGVRYVHEFSERESAGLASESGYNVVDSFLSDGADRHSGLYQIWKLA